MSLRRRLLLLLPLALACSSGCSAEPAAGPPSASESVPAAIASTAAPAPVAESSAHAAPIEASAPPATDCRIILASIAERSERLAKNHAHLTCTTDADCTCYGPPECKGPLVRGCPSAISVAAARELRPLVEKWVASDCGPFLWSPYRCVPVCTKGRCTSAE